jgi:cephalosporin-C deacetylase-like acetyl esterase
MRFPVLILAGTLLRTASFAAETNEYLNFIRNQAVELRRGERLPQTAAEWNQNKSALRDRLGAAWGDPQTRLGKLEAQRFGEIRREQYRIEKLAIQTFPGVWMTANAYVPDNRGPAKLPAILMVHGHWRGAKQDPTVQARCIGAARKGFFVLVVDAFGAGERGIGKALGEYHGDMIAATLLPTGLTLSGLQVAENMRAVDYLVSRAEVDPARIGITGASGGGNQTMYAAGYDERFRAAAPVCSVGNYQAYLGAACCYCELVPGALRFTEEWAVLGMTAPRALLVINASRDSRQFSIEEAKISLEKTAAVFELLGQPEHLRHTTFDSGHDYSKPMREAVYGWMTVHLKNEGEGAPITEDPFTPEDPETLRCYPGNARPENFVTIPRFAGAEARRLLAERENAPKSPEQLRTALTNLLGGFPPPAEFSLKVQTNQDGTAREIMFSPESGLTLRARHRFGADTNRLLIILDLNGAAVAEKSELAAETAARDWNIVTLDPRATGQLAWPNDKINRAPDHTTAQWALWIGRPLLGQWTHDVRRLLDVLQLTDRALPNEIAVVGYGPAGMIALTMAALDDRITHVASVGMLGTFVTDAPYEGQRMGMIVPGMLKEFGDIAELAGLVAPKPLLIAGPVNAAGQPIDAARLPGLFGAATRRFEALSAGRALQLSSASASEAVTGFLDLHRLK